MFVYCLFYYRVLGVLTILSLVLSGVVVYAVLVLLGRWVGFTLDLAGVAGFIVAIGITADSFVIFFERLKDEVREGRSFRSAVPRAWVRARRTILSADAVSFLAAAVLYVLAVGQVKGFAFTLGMSTVLDLVVVFLVTHPLVALASNNRVFSSPALVRAGLGGADRRGPPRRRREGRLTMADTTSAGRPTGPRDGRASVFSRLYTGTGAFDVVGQRKLWYVLFGTLVLVCVGSIVFRGFNLGIDFTGGTQIQFPAAGAGAPATVEDVRAVYEQAIGQEPAAVQTVGQGTAASVLIRSEPLDAEPDRHAPAGPVRPVPADRQRRPALRWRRSASPT